MLLKCVSKWTDANVGVHMSITCAAETFLQACTPIFRTAVVTLYLVYFRNYA